MRLNFCSDGIDVWTWGESRLRLLFAIPAFEKLIKHVGREAKNPDMLFEFRVTQHPADVSVSLNFSHAGVAGGGVTARMVQLIIIKNKTKLTKCILRYNPTPLNQILV